MSNGSFAAIFSPVIAVLIVVSVLIATITIVMTALYNKARTVDRTDKLEYISAIWVGSRSGFLRTMFLLWCPILTAFVFYTPVMALSKYHGRMGVALSQFAAALR